MSEWPMVKLGEVARVVAGGTPKTSVLEYWDGDIPWVTPKDLALSESLWINAGERFITDYGLAKSAAALLPRGTVLWSSRAPIGLVAIANNQIATNQGFKSFVPGGELDSEYLAYFLIHQRPILEMMGVGATFKEVSAKRAAEIMVPLPPLGEQKRIAEILGEVSKAIELVSRQLEILDDGLKTKMWNDADESSHVPLDHYIQRITSGKSLKEGDSEDYQNAVLKISAVTTGYFNEMEVKPLPKSYDPPESHRANNGDILLSRANTTELVGASALVETAATNLFLPDKLWKLQLKDQVNAYFFWHLLQTKIVRSSISKASSGSGGSMKNISQKAFLAISVPDFSNEVQNQIGNIVREQRALRHLLHRKLSLLQELQKSLATRAFAGLL